MDATFSSSINIKHSVFNLIEFDLNKRLNSFRFETLAKKKLKRNHGKSRYVILGSEEFKAKTRKEAKGAPVMIGSHIMEESPEEK